MSVPEFIARTSKQPRISNHVDEFGEPDRKAVTRLLRQIADRLDTHRDNSGEVLQMLVDDLAELGYSPSDQDAE